MAGRIMRQLIAPKNYRGLDVIIGKPKWIYQNFLYRSTKEFEILKTEREY